MVEENNYKTNKEILEDEVAIVDNSTRIQKVIISLLILLFLYIFGLFILRFMIDTNELEKMLNESVQSVLKSKEKTNNSFEISENISFNSFLVPHLIIKDIKINNLLQDKYKINSNIKEVKLYLSARHLFIKKIVIKKIEIIDGYFDLKEEKEFSKSEDIKKIFNIYLNNILSKNNIPIHIINNNIKFETNTYIREFTNINTISIVNINRVETSGELFSNKQPLKLNLVLKNNKNNLDLKIKLNSQAFNVATNFKISLNDNTFTGNTSFNIFNLQLFSKTIFDTENFLYKRIISNTNLKGKFSFKYEDKIFYLIKLDFDGRHLKGNGEAEINLLENKNNKIKLYFDNINFDNLIIKNFVNKTINNISENDIFIFSGKFSQKAQQNKEKTYIQKIFNINQTDFDIIIKSAILNQSNIADTTINFSYFNNYKFKINNFSSLLPGETKILLQTTSENKNSITMSGNNLEEFWNFIKNTKYIKKEKQNKFILNGYFDIINNVMFFNNIEFSTQNIKTTNTAEVGFDKGISYIAINSNIDNIDINDILKYEELNNEINNSNLLKNRILFLNDFSIRSLLKFNIKNIKYKNIIGHNYSFIIKTSQGILNIRKINLDNKITGSIDLNITHSNPMLNIILNIDNHKFKKEILFNDFLFAIPTFEDINGTISINGKNSEFKKSSLNNFTFSSTLKNGIFNFDNFNIDGFGGKCKITGFLDLKFNRKLNVIFNACTADLDEILYLFTKNNVISGLIGFSSVLYSQGNTLNSFLQNYIFKTQLIGNGILINKFGLYDLNSILLKMNINPELAKTIKTNEILFNKNNKTIFNSLSGNLQYINKNGQLDIDISRPLINGKFSGKFDFSNKGLELNSSIIFIMLAGNLNNAINLTIPIYIAGNSIDGFKCITNYKQINDYINAIKQGLFQNHLSLNTNF